MERRARVLSVGLAKSPSLAPNADAKRAAAPARAVEAKVAVALGVLQHRGVGFDRERARGQIEAANERVEELEAEARRAARGIDANLASAAQVADVLYNKLKLPVPSTHAMKGSKTSHLTTSVEVLHSRDAASVPARRARAPSAPRREPCARDTIERRSAKMSLALEFTRRGITRKQRRSSVVESSEHSTGGTRLERNLFTPLGRTFIAADYSQIELRVLAHLSEDQRLISLLRKASDAGGDVFVYIWNAGKGLPLDAPAPAETRNRAKTTATHRVRTTSHRSRRKIGNLQG